jgi:hypothetical protein
VLGIALNLRKDTNHLLSLLGNYSSICLWKNSHTTRALELPTAKANSR